MAPAFKSVLCRTSASQLLTMISLGGFLVNPAIFAIPFVNFGDMSFSTSWFFKDNFWLSHSKNLVLGRKITLYLLSIYAKNLACIRNFAPDWRPVLYYQPSAAAARQLGSSTKHSERARIPMPWRSIHQEQEKRSRKRKEEERKRSRLTSRLNWNLCGSSDASVDMDSFLQQREFSVCRFCRVQVTPVSKIEFGSSFLSFRFVVCRLELMLLLLLLCNGWPPDWLTELQCSVKKKCQQKAGTHQKLIGLPASLSLSLPVTLIGSDCPLTTSWPPIFFCCCYILAFFLSLSYEKASNFPLFLSPFLFSATKVQSIIY